MDQQVLLIRLLKSPYSVEQLAADSGVDQAHVRLVLQRFAETGIALALDPPADDVWQLSPCWLPALDAPASQTSRR
jgi:hypothetical protein